MKITTKSNETSVKMKLEGRLAGPFVNELDQQWQKQFPELAGKKLVVDLCDLTFADAAGRELLGHIRATSDADFLADSLFTKYLADEATRCTVGNKEAVNVSKVSKKLTKTEGN